MKCAYCNARHASDPLDPGAYRCAFEDGRFNRDNWNCATMNRLRAIARNLGHLHQQDDNSLAYIPIAEADEDGTVGYIVLSWYKDRGRTDHALFVNCDRPISELTLDLAEAVIAKYADKQVSAS